MAPVPHANMEAPSRPEAAPGPPAAPEVTVHIHMGNTQVHMPWYCQFDSPFSRAIANATLADEWHLLGELLTQQAAWVEETYIHAYKWAFETRHMKWIPVEEMGLPGTLEPTYALMSNASEKPADGPIRLSLVCEPGAGLTVTETMDDFGFPRCEVPLEDRQDSELVLYAVRGTFVPLVGDMEDLVRPAHPVATLRHIYAPSAVHERHTLHRVDQLGTVELQDTPVRACMPTGLFECPLLSCWANGCVRQTHYVIELTPEERRKAAFAPVLLPWRGDNPMLYLFGMWKHAGIDERVDLQPRTRKRSMLAVTTVKRFKQLRAAEACVVITVPSMAPVFRMHKFEAGVTATEAAEADHDAGTDAAVLLRLLQDIVGFAEPHLVMFEPIEIVEWHVPEWRLSTADPMTEDAKDDVSP